MSTWAKKYEQNKRRLYFSLIATFVWGLIAHGYGFMHNSFSHDSLSEFSGSFFGNDFKIQLGRFVVPIYRAVFRTDLTLPWLIGVLSLIWIGLAVFLVIKIFRIESKAFSFVIAGILTVNTTVSATIATYLHDYDCDMFALFCSVAAVYLWQAYKWGFAAGALFLVLALGIYQSYISVAITLIMFACILLLLNEESFQSVFFKGLKAIAMLILGGLLYYIFMKISQAVSGVDLLSGNYNSVDRVLELSVFSVPQLILDAYKSCYAHLVSTFSPYPSAMVTAATWFMLFIVAAAGVAYLKNPRAGVFQKGLCLGLIVLIPLGMNITYVLVSGYVHVLMTYAIWLLYVLALLLSGWLVKYLLNKGASKRFAYIQHVCVALVVFMLYSNVQTSNAIYLKKDMEHDANLSLMTRIFYMMEDFEAYEPGTTPVLFAGTPDPLIPVMPGFERYQNMTGLWSVSSIPFPTRDHYQAYIRYILANPAVLADQAVWEKLLADPRVAAMPCYPNDGCLAMIDQVLVVKLGYWL